MNRQFFSNSIDELKKLPFLDKPYRIRQIIDLVVKNRIFDFRSMTNLPKDLRDKLFLNFEVLDLILVDRIGSGDGTIKFLFKTTENLFIESVYLKDKNNRITFCISSQSGCRMGCVFCKTGRMGLVGNLTFSQIVSQVLYLSKIMNDDPDVTDTSFNIVFMGMGEPLDNFDNLISSIRILTSPDFFGIPQARITVSTCGIKDRIEPLLKEFGDIRLALSLVSANQVKRESVIPMAKKNMLGELINVLKTCHELYGNRITLEYVLIRNFNMDDDDILDLEKFKTDYFHLNIIPVNSDDDSRPSEREIREFMSKLAKAGFIVTRRYRRGDDIKADCGQSFWDYDKSDEKQ